jgi:hypothetical protein
MKIGTLTFHTAHNYGAVLQAYALVHYMQGLGHQAEVIDYKPDFNAKRFAPKPLSHYLNIRELYSIFFHNSYQRLCPDAFEDFYRDYLPLSKTSYTKEELDQSEDLYDCIVTGSDQVWNLACTAGDDAYFLPFVKDERKKCSYAASLGVMQIKEDLRASMRDYLQSFRGLSVREHEGVDIVRNLTGKEAIQVVDPTLLLDKEKWIKIADTSLCIKEKYLLLYLMSEDPEILKFASRYAHKYGLKVIYISKRLFDRVKAEHIRCATPNQWLGLFLNANTIVTNSFHGAAFGVNFNKNVFIKYIPRSIANSRLKSIVSDYHLKSHLLTKENIQNNEFPAIDLFTLNRNLDANRQKSRKYIQDVILTK